MDLNKSLSRREALRHLSAGTLFAMGLWPGALRADESGDDQSGTFRFVVINDTHCLSTECGDYVAGAVAQMKSEPADFCLHLGDLTDTGEREWMEMVKSAFMRLSGPMYPLLGNHDYRTASDCAAFVETFPGRVNYSFENRGWQFVGLNSTQGQLYDKTSISPETLRWVDDNLPRLDRKRPMVIFTHFPLGPGVKYRPANADDLLDRFRDFNLRAVFNGHWHGFTERKREEVVIVTNRCCSLKRDNHDGTKEKGYFVCQAKDGQVAREFVEYKPARKASAPASIR